MAGLLDGLGSFGLGDLENASIFEKEKEVDENQASLSPEQAKTQQEIEFLFDKSYSCPICDKEFKSKTVKAGKAKLAGTDMDLRPRYEGIDIIKYDVVMCPRCGYATLGRYFKYISDFQAKRIRETISKSFKAQEENKDLYTYEDALERYKLTLANAIVKQAKASEKAYVCLKTAWLLRSQQDNMDVVALDYEEKKNASHEEEREFLKNALEGFITARQKEGFPMCGMDEMTVDYLIGVLAMNFGQFDVSSKMIAGILGSKTANPRMKDKARDLKEVVMAEIRKNK